MVSRSPCALILSATSRGVLFFPLRIPVARAVGLAPASSSALIVSGLPARTAQCSGVPHSADSTLGSWPTHPRLGGGEEQVRGEVGPGCDQLLDQVDGCARARPR